MNEASQRVGDPRTTGSRREVATLAVFLIAVILASLIALGTARPAETQSAPYSMAVDNANQNRFLASGAWKKAYNGSHFGSDFAYSRPGKANLAWFKTKIPTTGRYAVYARWPANKGYNASTPIGVNSVSGMKWKRVNQRVNGGRWVKIGTYGMKSGDRYNVAVARNAGGGGPVIADAVRVVRVNPNPARNPDSILGRPIYSQAQVTNYARSVGSTKYIMQAIPHYYNLGPRVGIAPDFLVAQSMIETGYGRYGGDSRPWNMAGIKKGGNVGDEPRDFERPASAYEGVRMHVNHMAAYTNRPTIGTPHARYYDARSAQRGRGYWVTRISQLGNGVWATDPYYSGKIRRILNDMG